MKNLKWALSATALILAGMTGYSQTNNTFPSSGNTGIGTTSPNTKLQVCGNVKFDSTLVVRDTIRAQRDVKVDGNLFVGGESYFTGPLNYNSTRFGSGAFKSDFFPASGGAPAVVRSGPVAEGPDLPGTLLPCYVPTIPLINAINGMYVSYGTPAGGGPANSMMMGFDGSNGSIDMAGTNNTNPDAPKLLINYYCGKEVAICTGRYGGNIIMTTESAGKVGIGTSNPLGDFELKKTNGVNAYFTSATPNNSRIHVGNNLGAFTFGTNALGKGEITDGTNTLLSFSPGMVGVGSLVPDEKFQIKTGAYTVSFGNALFADLSFGTSYMGFNANRTTAGTWKTGTDGFHNGGAIFYSNVVGDMFFASIPDNGAGSTGQTGITDAQVKGNVRLYIESTSGAVGIGTTCVPYMLTVEGGIGSRDVWVKTNSWCDFVFNKDYKKLSIKELETYIEENKHLPNIPSEKEVLSKGEFSLTDASKAHLQKIEELTLYLIEINKRLEAAEKKNVELEQKIKVLENNK